MDMKVKCKRVYLPAEESTGYRVLVAHISPPRHRHIII